MQATRAYCLKSNLLTVESLNTDSTISWQYISVKLLPAWLAEYHTDAALHKGADELWSHLEEYHRQQWGTEFWAIMHLPHTQLKGVLLQTVDRTFLYQDDHTKAPEVGAASLLNANPDCHVNTGSVPPLQHLGW